MRMGETKNNFLVWEVETEEPKKVYVDPGQVRRIRRVDRWRSGREGEYVLPPPWVFPSLLVAPSNYVDTHVPCSF